MQAPNLLKYLTVQESASPRETIIWLHGLGATCDDFLPIVPNLKLRPETKIIFPQAPSRAITIHQGFSCPAWYDIVNFDLNQRDTDREGIEASAAQIEVLAQIERDAGRRVHIAGFSQGGAMALYLINRFDYASAAVLSAYTLIPLEKSAEALPVLHQHGEFDEKIPLSFGEKSHRDANAAGYQTRWESYPMAHEVCLPQIESLSAWYRELGL